MQKRRKILDNIKSKIRSKIKKIFRNAEFNFIKNSKKELIVESENFKILIDWEILSKDEKIENKIKEIKHKVKKNHLNVGLIILYSKDKFNLVKEDKLKIWNLLYIDYFYEVSKNIGTWAKYNILSDLGYQKRFDKNKRIHSIQIKQSGGDLYVFSIDPETLLKMAYVFRRPVSPKAYQRMLKPQRIKKDIPDFLEKPEAILPTSITCVLPQKAVFEKNKLIVPSKFSSVWIIDGQHRLYSFANVRNLEMLRKFNLICVGLKEAQFPLKKQGKIFIDINYNAKKVSTDLLLDLYEILDIKDRRVEIVKSLNSAGVFKDNIKSPSNPKGIISLPTFSLTPAMEALVRNGGHLSNYYKDKFQEDKFQNFCVRNINLFFSIISKVFPAKWKNPKKYILCTNRGVRAFLRLFPFVLKYKNRIDEKDIIKVIRCLNDFEFSNSKLTGKYLGEGGADDFAKRLVEHIQTKMAGFPPYETQEVILTITIYPGEKEKANNFIKKWLSKLGGEVKGELSYIDRSSFAYFEFLPKKCKKVELLVSDIKDPDKCFKKAEGLMNNKKLNMIIKKIKKIKEDKTRKEFEHERWLANKEYEIDLGADLKRSAIANTKHSIKVLNKPMLSNRFKEFSKIFEGLKILGKEKIEIESFFPKDD